MGSMLKRFEWLLYQNEIKIMTKKLILYVTLEFYAKWYPGPPLVSGPELTTVYTCLKTRKSQLFLLRVVEWSVHGLSACQAGQPSLIPRLWRVGCAKKQKVVQIKPIMGLWLCLYLKRHKKKNQEFRGLLSWVPSILSFSQKHKGNLPFWTLF